MTEYDKIIEQWWENEDLTLPTWALREGRETAINDYVNSKCGELCPACKTILRKREKYRAKLCR